MGDRLYNAVTGRFTSPDPEPGGNPTAYTYPTDPINKYDLDGHWGWSWAKKAWNRAKKWSTRYDYGSVSAGVFNMGYGSYRVWRGSLLLRAAPLCAMYAAGVGLAVCGGLGALGVASGGFRAARGVRQTYRFAKKPRCYKQCGVRGNAKRFIKGVTPKWSGDWIDRLGGY